MALGLGSSSAVIAYCPIFLPSVSLLRPLQFAMASPISVDDGSGNSASGANATLVLLE